MTKSGVQNIIGACPPARPEAEWPEHWRDVAYKVRVVKRALNGNYIPEEKQS